MALKLYRIEVSIHHTVEVEASEDWEAEELALDAFNDEQDYWDDIYFDILEIEEYEDEEE